MISSRFSSEKRVSLAVPIQRVRVRFSRGTAASSVSHLQQIEIIRRALEKSSWPLAKTNSKKPRVRASFGPAISVGYTSEAEFCDVELEARLDFPKAKEELNANMSDGFSVLEVKSIPRFFPSLDQTLNCARYEIRSPLLLSKVSTWEEFWKSEHFIVIKKKADEQMAIDARPLIKSWNLTGELLVLDVRFGPGRTLKPERIVQAVCGFSEEECEMGKPACRLLVHRSKMFFEKQNGELVEP